MLRNKVIILCFFCSGVFAGNNIEIEILEETLNINALSVAPASAAKILKEKLDKSKKDNKDSPYKMRLITPAVSLSGCHFIKIYENETNYLGCYRYNY
jgi:hypothetical protein